MNFRELFAEEDAVSPVIGVILMVAITVILAAVIGTFVLGLGDQVQNTAPQASFSFSFTDEDTSSDELDITHDGGDKLTASQTFIKPSGVESQDADTLTYTSNNDWATIDSTSPTSVTAGESLTLDGGEWTNDAAGDGTSEPQFNKATVRVVWQGQSGDNTATIGKWSGPDA